MAKQQYIWSTDLKPPAEYIIDARPHGQVEKKKKDSGVGMPVGWLSRTASMIESNKSQAVTVLALTFIT